MVFRYWYKAGEAKVIHDVERVINYSRGTLKISRTVLDGLELIVLIESKDYTRFTITKE